MSMSNELLEMLFEACGFDDRHKSALRQVFLMIGHNNAFTVFFVEIDPMASCLMIKRKAMLCQYLDEFFRS